MAKPHGTLIWVALVVGLMVGCANDKTGDSNAPGDAGGDGALDDGSSAPVLDASDAAQARDATRADATSLDSSSDAVSGPNDAASVALDSASDAANTALDSASDATMDASDAAPGSSDTGPGSAPDAGPTKLTGSAASLDFTRLEVGVQSSAQSWTLTNSGSSASGALTLLNPDPTHIIVTNQCTSPLAAGASCNISVSLKLSQGGSYSGWLTLQSAQSGSLNLNLGATGAYRLTVTTSGTGAVTSTAGGIACGATCSGVFDAGTMLTLQVRTTNGAGYFFSGWGGTGCSGAMRDCRITLDATTTVSATFTPMTHNLVFVSSAAFPTNRGSAAAYDSDCNAAATAAGINNAAGNAYVAATTDANSSVQSRLGGSARGWVRMDAKPFKDVFSGPSAQDPVLNTVRYTELGEAVGSLIGVMSGLPYSGAPYNCRNFTSNSSADTVASGLTEGGPGRWILNQEGGTYFMCSDGPYRIICLGKTSTAAIPATPFAGKLIWTSTGKYQPPAITPDQVCQNEKPPSVTTAAALVDYEGRSHASVLSLGAKYYRRDGTLVGTGQDLADATTLESGIWQDATGNYLTVSALVVTGGGQGPFVGTCSDWTSTSGMVASGDTTWPEGETWWRGNNLQCATMDLRFYCVQTAP